ncbi:mitochondrial protein [Kwoniella mangroviensis CBS 8886]|uniref:uncharacterized protein n=1 Tax=Kwoniella mangroviensis CBS 8507 TaxID=1296122 RepID=UPI00080D10D5|nr:mitochondrial protein [Kwoniella mangroviensis CBS 8507]OCF69582.1 mitochondrial protein [Kwoniella mangroviensis CBS 8507]OCF70962.1 mitochondrial protein [Kwoniella mangroviensis CBS 8886]
MSSLLKNIPSITHLSQKSILEITGPDSTKFLKGLSCKDVDNLGGGYSGFLNASGRVLHTSFIFPTVKKAIMKNGNVKEEKSYLITHESPIVHPAKLEEFLPPFKLRAKVRIRDVSDQWDLYSAYASTSSLEKGKGPERNWKFGSGGAAESQWSWKDGVQDMELKENEVGCWDLRAGWGQDGLGRQVLVPKGDKPSLASSHDTAPIDEYHFRRMILGVPEGPNEIIPGQALPLESCMDLHGGVDFRKGCYLGQELTVRTYHTGATRKRILPIRLIPLTTNTNPNTSLSDYLSTATPTQIPIGQTDEQLEITYTPSSSASSKKPRSAGKILSLHPSSMGVGLGLVRIEFAERSCWSNINLNQSIKNWYENDENHRLTTKIGDQTYGVYVDKGEAYGEALKAMGRQAGEL